MKKIFISYLILLSGLASAQNVGIGNPIPDASAMLDVTATNKGLLVPRVGLTGTNVAAPVTAPATSLLVYNNATTADVTPGYYYWNGTAWQRLATGSGGGTGWLLTGNAGTVDGTNFIGTTDNVSFNVRVFNEKAGRIDPNLLNTSWGYKAGNVNMTGISNTANGASALKSNTAGSYNTANGVSALFSNITGERNTANGYQALTFNTTGFSNVAIGFSALRNNSTSSNLVAVGDSALYKNLGFQNTAVGSKALYSNTTGNNNTALGIGADVSSDNLINATAIGANAKVGASNSMALGGTGSNAVNVGIGVSSPISTLHVKGTANFFSGADTRTGSVYNGTSSLNAIELVTSVTDAYMAVQRSGSFAGLHVTKPAGSMGSLVSFGVNGAEVGTISTNGTTTNYNTTSDKRLKENITATHYGLSTVMKLNVKDYNYISDNKKALQTGLLAQELYAVYPQAVKEGGADASTNPWMVDYSKLTAVLVKAVQELSEQNTSLKQNLSTQTEKLSTQTNDILLLKNEMEQIKLILKKQNP